MSNEDNNEKNNKKNNRNNSVENFQSTSKEEQVDVDYESSPGQQLKKAREALGLSLQQVADSLHLRVPSVEAVEQDALEKDVSVTFSKGYVRLYAKLVHLEVQPLLEAYDELHLRDNHSAKLQSFSRRVSREADDHKWNMVTIVVVLLVLGSVIGWWVQQSDSLSTSQSFVSDTFDGLFTEDEQADGESESAGDEAFNTENFDKNEVAVGQSTAGQTVARLNTGPEIPEEDLANTASNVTLIDESENVTNNVLVVDDVQDAEQINDDLLNTTAGTNQDTMTTDGAEKAEGASMSSPIVISDALVNDDNSVSMAFNFKADCWVSVKDLNDEVIAIGVKKKGRLMEISGKAPIHVILCSPENVDIEFGGKDIDMSIYPAGRPANFTLTLRENNVFRISN